MILKPRRLEPGDTIALVAPASAPPDPAAIDRSQAWLQKAGYRVHLPRYVRKRFGFLAGSDQERAADLMRAFTHPKVNGILCVRGGYGSGRLLPLLDFEAIRRNPKVFIGYSDITALQMAFWKRCRLVTFHGPMLNSDLLKEDVPEFTVNGLWRTVAQPVAAGSVRTGEGSSGIKPETLCPGHAVGRLAGGNLTLLCAALGTPFFPSLRRAILFFEDLNEVPYRFDRMLTQLHYAGALEGLAGVAIGVNAGCEAEAAPAGEYTQSLVEVLRERLAPLGVPVVWNLPFGHVKWNATVPVGVRARLDGDRADLEIVESAVA
jgi:muramoyltetrapeptide carboxypeptidase